MRLPDISADALYRLWEEQIHCWETARHNYEALATVKERTIEIGGVVFRIQHNPGRITSVSSSARTTAERPCFLCKNNLPAKQLRIPYMDDYHILVNPFPIFRRHFTIPAITHTPQRIDGRMETMLDLTRLCSPYTLFYNGARCGASAPMHMHFQAVNDGYLPIENQWRETSRTAISAHGTAQLFILENLLRPVLMITATDSNDATALFSKLCHALPSAGLEEPMINIVTRYESGQWLILLFLRRKHRPDRYYATDNTQRLISPGAVEMGGVIITPRPEDFERLTAQEIVEIYQEVCPDKSDISRILQRLQ